MADSAPKNTPLDPSLNARDPENPIQPGQFVTVSSEDGIFKQPPIPYRAAQATGANQAPTPTAPTQPPIIPPPPPPAPQNPPQPPPPLQFVQEQPNPTPFVSPNTPPVPESPSVFKKLRIFIIIIAAFLFITLAAVVVWLVVLDKTIPFLPIQKTSKTETDENTQILVIPTPQPKRTTGGFGDLPQATGESNQATASATPQATPPTQ